LTIVGEYEVIIGEDFNQDITTREIKDFYSELGLKDTHSAFNIIDTENLDYTYITGSKCIYSIAVSNTLIEFIEGS